MRITWDDTGTRYFEMGAKNCVLYPMLSDGTYDSGVAWNGITAFTESPSGAEPTDLWADDMKYATMRSAEEFGANIEAYTYPDEWAQCDGSAAIATGVYIGQQRRQKFGLSVRTQIGNDIDDAVGYRLHLVYNATASPSEKSYNTINDSPDAITFSWEISTTPTAIASQYKPTACITIDSTKVDATKLAALEDMLYGTTNSDPTLPTPAEVLTLFGGDVEVTGIGVTPSSVSVAVGENVRLSSTLYPTGATGTVTWSSSADATATVTSAGLVEGVAAGTATITATCNGKTDTCTVTVTNE